eukprot:gene14334-9173_t
MIWLCNFIFLLSTFVKTTAEDQPCTTILVHGFANHHCVESPCQGCDTPAALVNGNYTLVSGATEQSLPVWAKIRDGVGDGDSNDMLFLYYDTFYQYSLSSAGEHPGWAIGRSVGSVCTDDWGYCSFDHTPAGCCTHSTGCTRYWAKQTSRTWDCSNSPGCPGPECTVERNGGCPDRRVTPDLVAKAALWTHSTAASIPGISMTCIDGAGAAGGATALSTATATTLIELGVTVNECALGMPASADDCRETRCQGCPSNAHDGCNGDAGNVGDLPLSCGCGATTTPPPDTRSNTCNCTHGRRGVRNLD